jgi:hypothetical protein
MNLSRKRRNIVSLAAVLAFAFAIVLAGCSNKKVIRDER